MGADADMPKQMLLSMNWTGLSKEDIMAIKGARTIAEYAVRNWMKEHDFAPAYFDIVMNKNEAVIKDQNGDTLTLVYDSKSKEMYIKES